MAGIIVDISQDIKKLQELRTEIEKVKNELKGINISVKIDIKEGLEKQLKSLTNQYDALSTKVSETEGKIMLSLRNIDKATEKIIQAQTKLTNVSAPSSLSMLSSNVSLETDGVKAQAQAYDELKVAIEAVYGVRSNNITRMLREQEQMKQYQKELKELDKAPITDESNKRFVELTENIERSKIAIAELRQAVKKDIKLEMAAPNSVDALSQSLSKMKDVWKGLSPEELESPFGKELTATIQQADEKIKELSATIGEHQRKVGNYENATKRLRIEQRDLVEEIAELTLQYRAMSNAEKKSGVGKELEQKINSLTDRAATLKDAMADVNREISGKASDTSAFSSINEGINLIISGFGAATGAAQLLGLSEEDLLEIQTKLQAAYVVGNALVRIQNTLQKESNLMVGIGVLQSKAAAKAIAIEVAAKNKNVIATKAATVAQNAFNLVAKANPYILLATAIVSVVGALWAFSKGQTESKKKIEEFNKGVTDTAAISIAKIEELSMKWNRLGDNLVAKKKFVEDNKKAFNDLGISILDVVDAENVLNNNKDAFIKAMIERAKAAQYIKQQEENIKELIKAEQDLEATKGLKFEDFSSGGTYISAEERKNTAIAAAQYRYDEIAKKIKEGYTFAAKAEEEGSKILDNARIKSTNKAENLVDDYTYKMITGLDRGRSNFDSFAKNISKGYNSLLDKMKDSTTTFSQKISTLFSTLFSSDKIIEEGRLTIGERITKLQSDYTAAQNKLKGLRKSSSKATQDEINDAEKEVNKIAGIYRSLTGKEINNPKEYNSIVDQQKKISELLDKQATERKRKEQDLENQLTQSRIDAMAEGEAKIRAQRELDNKKEIQDLERQREDYIRTEIELQRKAFDEQENLRAKQTKNYKKRTFDESAVKVDTSAFYYIIGNTKKRQFSDQMREQEQAWDEYIIKYGTFQQKKEAIARKYNKAIEEAATAGEAASLQKEFEEALSNLNLDKLKNTINWQVIFGDLSKITKDQLTKVKAQLNEFKKSSEFKNATPDQIKVIEEAVDNINNALIDKSGFFGGLGDSLTEYEQAVVKVTEAQTELNKALESGDEVAIEKAREKKNAAELNQLNAQVNAEKSRDKAISNINAVADAMTRLSDGSASLSEVGDIVGNLVDAFAESGSKIGGIIGAILSIIDQIGEKGVVGFAGGIVKSLGHVAEKAWGGFANVLTLGKFNIGGADYSDYNEMVEEYNKLNDIWDELIDKKKEYIDMSYGPEAAKAGEEAIEIAKKSIESYKLLGKERLNSGASTGSHSIGVRIRNSMSQELWDQWDEFAKSIGQNPDAIGGRLTGLFDLTAEQLEKLKEEAPGFWSKLDGDVQNYLNKIIEGEERIEDIQKDVQEQLTQTSFDSLFDSFVNTLMDMNASSQDFADNFGEYMRKAVFTQMFAEGYEDELREWYKSFSAAMGKEGGLTVADREKLKEDWDTIVNGALEDRKAWEQIVGGGGTSISQESSKKGFATMSQDSADELNGRFTALQIAGEEIKNQNQLQTMSILELKAGMLTISANSSGIKDIASETRDLIRLSYEAITDIRDNTNVMVKPIQQMAADIAEVKRNTNGLSKK